MKFHAMSAAAGLERQHWGIGGQPQQGYWAGPWNIMGFLEKVTQKKRPAYYTYKLMREKLRDFLVGDVADLSASSVRVFEFITPNGNVYVAWDADGGVTRAQRISVPCSAKGKSPSPPSSRN